MVLFYQKSLVMALFPVKFHPRYFYHSAFWFPFLPSSVITLSPLIFHNAVYLYPRGQPLDRPSSCMSVMCFPYFSKFTLKCKREESVRGNRIEEQIEEKILALICFTNACFWGSILKGHKGWRKKLLKRWQR